MHTGIVLGVAQLLLELSQTLLLLSLLVLALPTNENKKQRKHNRILILSAPLHALVLEALLLEFLLLLLELLLEVLLLLLHAAHLLGVHVGELLVLLLHHALALLLQSRNEQKIRRINQSNPTLQSIYLNFSCLSASNWRPCSSKWRRCSSDMVCRFSCS